MCYGVASTTLHAPYSEYLAVNIYGGRSKGSFCLPPYQCYVQIGSYQNINKFMKNISWILINGFKYGKKLYF